MPISERGNNFQPWTVKRIYEPWRVRKTWQQIVDEYKKEQIEKDSPSGPTDEGN